VPKALIIEMFFAAEQKVIDDTDAAIIVAQAELDEMIENAEEDSVISDVLKDNGSLDVKELNCILKVTLNEEHARILRELQKLVSRVKNCAKTAKDLRAALDKKTREQYTELTEEQIMELLLNRKWYRSLMTGVHVLYTAVSHRISERVMELAERYEKTMPQLENEVAQLESKVKSHLERMGYEW